MKFQFSYLFLLVFSLFSILPLVSSRYYCHDSQKSALLHFFSDRSSLPSWRPNSDCCQWEGVTCNVSTGHVIALELADRSISSPINSSSFARLGSLLSLNLSYNNFSSPIPSNLSLLSNLNHLSLSNSGFVGQIPAEIARLNKLVALDISTSFLDSPLTVLKLENNSIGLLLGNLSRLTELHLDGVNVASAVPKFLSNFTQLACLRLSFCGLVGEFPANIFLLPKLETLDVSANFQLIGSFPDFPRESALRTLQLFATGFSGSLPYSFGNLKNLSLADLSNCDFSGPIPSSVRNISGIVHLKLNLNRFSGPIPSLDGLTELQHLDLSSNNLSGQIPQFFGDGLHNLTVLDLGENSLHGMIPSYLFTLPSLQKLVLDQNHLDGQLNEFGNIFSPLKTIDLSYNNLEGQIPSSMFGYTRLIVLDLSSNRFNGSVDLVVLQNMKNLSRLDLSNNNLLVNANADGTSFPQLRLLYLASCKLKRFPYFLRNQSWLMDLDLSNNNIDGEIPNWMWTVGSGYLRYLNLSQNLLLSLQQHHNLSSSTLSILDLHSNQLQGEIPRPPTSVVVLDYSKNNFTSTISSDFATSLGVAIFFSISGNNVSGEIPSSVCKASYLQVLDLSDNQLSGLIPNCINDMNLSVLNLRNNLLTGMIPNASSKKCSLRTLNLNGNQLEGKIPESLSNCGDLEVLDLGNNRLSGTFPYYLNTLSKLRVLVLRSNNFSSSLCQHCDFSLRVLQIIDLSFNNFQGTLPVRFLRSLNAMMSTEDEDADVPQVRYIQYGFLTGLYYQDTVIVRIKGLELELSKILSLFKSVDLSHNKFEGEIPKEIGALSLLLVINISSNHLTGPIPVSIGNLRQLESLDLSENQLSGRIPPQLAWLTFLEVLNLSHNQLVGSIPIGPQLLTFTEDSFLGNPQLCGVPLSSTCSPHEPPPTSTIEGGESLSSTVNWLIISLEVGYSVGLASLFGSLLLWKKWRIWYFKRVDMLSAYLLEKCRFI